MPLVQVISLRLLTIASEKVGRIELIPGEHKLSVRRGQEELFTNSFTLKSGGQVVIEATWQPRAKSNIPQAVQVPPQAPQREAAKSQPPKPRDTRTMQLLIDGDFQKSQSGFFSGELDRSKNDFVDGEYRIKGRMAGMWYTTPLGDLDRRGVEATLASDFIFETEARLMKSDAEIYGWTLSFNWRPDDTSWIQLRVDNEGRIGLFDHRQCLLPYTRTQSRLMTDLNTFRLEVIDGTLRVFVNGQFVVERTMDVIRSGLLLGFHTSKLPVDVRFRRIRLWRPEPGGAVSPTPADRPVYQADFRRKIPEFPEGKDATCRYEGGILFLQADKSASQRVGRVRPEGDYYAELTGRVAEGNGGCWAVVCGAGIRGGAWIEIRRDGDYRVRHLGVGPPQSLLLGWPPVEWMSHKAIRTGTEFNTVGVAVRKGLLRIYINGKWACDVADPSYSPGFLQVGVIADAEPTVAEFQKLQVWRLPPASDDP